MSQVDFQKAAIPFSTFCVKVMHIVVQHNFCDFYLHLYLVTPVLDNYMSGKLLI